MRKIEFERETDGRWIAEIPSIPGVMAYGETQAEARQAVERLARFAALLTTVGGIHILASLRGGVDGHALTVGAETRRTV